MEMQSRNRPDNLVGVVYLTFSSPNRATGLVNMRSFVTHLLASDRENGWFTLENQLREPVVTNRISPSARYCYRPGVEAYDPMDTPFPKSLQGFK